MKNSDKPTCGDNGGHKKNGEPCGYVAGWGTDFEDGKCKKHRGTSPDGESHKGNQNAQKHALYSSRDGYYQDLSDDAQTWIFDFTNSLLDRHREFNNREPDMFDKEALKNIAIDFHRVATANGYFREKGLTQTKYAQSEGGPVPVGDEVNAWASEIRQYNESIYRRMKKHGLLDDPESEQAKSTREFAQVARDALED